MIGQLLLYIISALFLNVLYRYLRWRYSPLNKIPGPIKNYTLKEWIVGVFSIIENEPFMQPHQRWWKEAEEEEAARHGASLLSTSSRSRMGSVIGNGISNGSSGSTNDSSNENINGTTSTTKSTTRHYETPLLHYTSLFGKQFICTLDADAVKQILTSKASTPTPTYIKGLHYLRKVVGAGLVTIDGTTWHRHRRIIQPSFNNQFLKDALSGCIPDLMDRFCHAWEVRSCKKGTCGDDGSDGDVNSDIDIATHFSALALDIIGKVAFSHEFQAIEEVERWGNSENSQVQLNDPLGLYSSLMPSAIRMLLVNLRLSSLEKFIVPAMHKSHIMLNKAVESVVSEAHTRYKNRKDEEDDNGNGIKGKKNKEPKCLLELLFNAKDTEPGARNQSLSHKELEGETKTFLVAGHETTSTLCVWSIYCLIQHPRVQSLVLEDILKHAPKEGQITLESLDKMSYLEAFLNEVLRLYPPVGMVIRSTTQWVKLMGENIPPHTRVMIPIYLLQRHPRYWSEPEEFKPERWLNHGERDAKFHHFAYLPFSAGPRNCIGQRFAMWEAKLILAPIIRKFELAMSPAMDGVDLKLVSFITIKSVPPVLIRVKPRC